MAVESDSQGEYLYVADYNSSQVSEYKVAIQTGVLTALSTPAISTGANPSAVVVRAGTGTLLSTGGTSYFVFTSNASAGTISSFTYDSTFWGLGFDWIGIAGHHGRPALSHGRPLKGVQRNTAKLPDELHAMESGPRNMGMKRT